MKHISIILAFLIIGVVQVVNAAPASPSATPTTEKNQKIEALKDRLATKVAELRTTERRAVYGTVKAVSISTLTVETPTRDVKIELNDDITVAQIIKGKRSTLKLEQVEKGDVVTIFGEYDTAVEILKAKVIFIEGASVTKRITGIIKEAKKADYTLSVAATDGNTYIVDFETSTKASTWNGEKITEKTPFSKLLPGDIVTVLGTPIAKKDNQLSALRILDLGNPTGEKPEEKEDAKEASAAAKPTTTPTPTKKS